MFYCIPNSCVFGRDKIASTERERGREEVVLEREKECRRAAASAANMAKLLPAFGRALPLDMQRRGANQASSLGVMQDEGEGESESDRNRIFRSECILKPHHRLPLKECRSSRLYIITIKLLAKGYLVRSDPGRT